MLDFQQREISGACGKTAWPPRPHPQATLAGTSISCGEGGNAVDAGSRACRCLCQSNRMRQALGETVCDLRAQRSTIPSFERSGRAPVAHLAGIRLGACPRYRSKIHSRHDSRAIDALVQTPFGITGSWNGTVFLNPRIKGGRRGYIVLNRLRAMARLASRRRHRFPRNPCSIDGAPQGWRNSAQPLLGKTCGAIAKQGRDGFNHTRCRDNRCALDGTGRL